MSNQHTKNGNGGTNDNWIASAVLIERHRPNLLTALQTANIPAGQQHLCMALLTSACVDMIADSLKLGAQGKAAAPAQRAAPHARRSIVKDVVKAAQTTIASRPRRGTTQGATPRAHKPQAEAAQPLST